MFLRPTLKHRPPPRPPRPPATFPNRNERDWRRLQELSRRQPRKTQRPLLCPKQETGYEPRLQIRKAPKECLLPLQTRRTSPCYAAKGLPILLLAIQAPIASSNQSIFFCPE